MKTLPQLPESSKPAFEINAINSPIEFFSGELEISGIPESPIVVKGSVVWEWQPLSGARFEAEVPDAHILFDADEIRVGAKGEPSCPTFVSNAQGNNPGIVSGHLDSFVLDLNEPVDWIVFHLPNFINYLGTNIQETNADTLNLRKGRLTLEVDGWVIHLDNLSSTKGTIEKLMRVGGYGITHTGKISRIDGAPFQYEEIKSLLSAFSFFLSFLRGFWTQPILLLGMRSNTDNQVSGSQPSPVLWVAENVKVEPWTNVQTWFSCFLAHEGPGIFEKLWSKWCKVESQSVLREAIGSYLEANGSAVSVQSLLILAQVALELMGYEILTDANGNEPSGPAASLIGDTLDTYGIPRDIPSQMTDLITLAAAPALKNNPSDPNFDGPGIIVSIRNALTHSKRSKRVRRSALTMAHLGQAWQLAMWYLDLVLLRWLEYNGEYACRWKSKWEGEFDDVPWNRSQT